ncbi:hypothetical protein KIL84_017303 [Mauremys mutica]|uniref:Uncharacterized protein n=1 Tax=Mauremys mutica TaxID=74926 RepID=A0A9D3X423_9SAUR|nr:hypothetical protein KIL84_017303 [Mauremys mutica]
MMQPVEANPSSGHFTSCAGRGPPVRGLRQQAAATQLQRPAARAQGASPSAPPRGPGPWTLRPARRIAQPKPARPLAAYWSLGPTAAAEPCRAELRRTPGARCGLSLRGSRPLTPPGRRLRATLRAGE